MRKLKGNRPFNDISSDKWPNWGELLPLVGPPSGSNRFALRPCLLLLCTNCWMREKKGKTERHTKNEELLQNAIGKSIIIFFIARILTMLSDTASSGPSTPICVLMTTLYFFGKIKFNWKIVALKSALKFNAQLTWNLRMSRGLPAFFKQFWLHFKKNFKKNLWRSRTFTLIECKFAMIYFLLPINNDRIRWSFISISTRLFVAASAAHDLVRQQNPLHFGILVLTLVYNRLLCHRVDESYENVLLLPRTWSAAAKVRRKIKTH